MLENKYLLFNKPILLENNLGTITQLTLRRLVEEDINIESIIAPFIIDRNFEKDDVHIFDIILINKLNGKDVLYNNLIKALSILYCTDVKNIQLNPSTASVVIDDRYVLNRHNYIYLCDCVMEIFKVDFGRIQREYDKMRKQKENEKPKTEIEIEIEKRRLEYEKRQEELKKEKHITDKPRKNIFDKANFVVHRMNMKYDDILDYSVYQVENSFELYYKIERYEQDRNYFTSGNFKLEDVQLQHWFF